MRPSVDRRRRAVTGALSVDRRVRAGRDGGRMRAVIVDCAIYRDGHRTDGPDDLSDALGEARAAGDASCGSGCTSRREAEFELVSRGVRAAPAGGGGRAQGASAAQAGGVRRLAVRRAEAGRYEPSSDTVSTGEVMLFLGDAFVVTVRHGEGRPLKEVRQRLEAEPEMLGTGPRRCCTRSRTPPSTTTWTWRPSSRPTWRSWRRRSSPRTAAARGTRRRGSTPFKRQVLEFRRATGPLAAPLARLAGTGASGRGAVRGRGGAAVLPGRQRPPHPRERVGGGPGPAGLGHPVGASGADGRAAERRHAEDLRVGGHGRGPHA